MHTPTTVPPVFATLDVETSDCHHEYPCALALVRVVDGIVTDKVTQLIRQPAHTFHRRNVSVHGITASRVASAPEFPAVWEHVLPLLADAAFIAAHNYGFERAVLTKSLKRANLPELAVPLTCTMQLARKTWGIGALAHVCRHLGIDLVHHDPLSDALACAQIVLRALSPTTPVAPSVPAAEPSPPHPNDPMKTIQDLTPTEVSELTQRATAYAQSPAGRVEVAQAVEASEQAEAHLQELRRVRPDAVKFPMNR